MVVELTTGAVEVSDLLNSELNFWIIHGVPSGSVVSISNDVELPAILKSYM